MTYRTGRLGRRYARAGLMDPRGHWAREPGASAGFIPEQSPILVGDGIVFAFVNARPQLAPPCILDESGKCLPPPKKTSQSSIDRVEVLRGGSTSFKLPRNAPKTRLKHGLLRRKR